MQVDANVSESDVGGIRLGHKATFTVDAYPKRTFGGTVTQVRQSPQTVQNVVTYDIVISVDNTDLTLMPGMTAASRIVVDQRNDVIRVPNQALRYVPSGRAGAGQSGQAQIWILQDGKPVAVPVVAGLDDDNFTEIVSGDVKPGDRRDYGGAGRDGQQDRHATLRSLIPVEHYVRRTRCRSRSSEL